MRMLPHGRRTVWQTYDAPRQRSVSANSVRARPRMQEQAILSAVRLFRFATVSKATSDCASYAAWLKQARIVKRVEFVAEYVVDSAQLVL
jgi:hypothetical protein